MSFKKFFLAAFACLSFFLPINSDFYLGFFFFFFLRQPSVYLGFFFEEILIFNVFSLHLILSFL